MTNLLASLKAIWKSSPLALILPVAALAVYWWTHGHTWTAASFPTFGEWTAGTMLLVARVEQLGSFVGGLAKRTPPVAVLLLVFFVGGCGTTKPVTIVTDIGSCAAIDLIGDVNNDLLVDTWEEELAKIATKCGLKVLDDVVAHVGAESAHAAQASGSDLESFKAGRARAWLASHPVQ